jgi:hypothetical protein
VLTSSGSAEKYCQGLWFLVLWALITLVASATAENLAAPSQSCGPPTYCARTDRKAEAYPKSPPSLGPAGSVITDPSFGSRIARVTDAKSDPNGKGRSLMTPSSAEQNSWNATSTTFYVLTPGAQDVLYDFDPSTMKARQREVLKLAWMGEPQFSYSKPDILYGLSRSAAAFEQYDTSNGRLTTLHKLSDCLKLGPADLGHNITVSSDDNRMSANVGPAQDAYPLVYVYDRQQGCRWYNTQTGEVGGQWGPKGTISIPDRALLHNSRMSKSGKFVYVTRGGGSGVGQGWLVWEVDTMNVLTCPSMCHSHHALGYSHIVGASGFSHPLDMISRPLDHLDRVTHLIPGLPTLNGVQFWYDQHYSWNNANSEDTSPVCLSTYNGRNSDQPGAAPEANSPWENEIVCVTTDGSGKVWRFAHTYSTARNGFWATPRGNVSSDGRFFIFTSDWQDQLGEAPNQGPKARFRTDVFVVELK